MAAVIAGRTPQRESFGATLRRLARASRDDNPFMNGVMSSAPAVTVGTAQPVGQSVGRMITDAALSLREFGGDPTLYGGFYHRFPVATLDGTGAGGNVLGAQDAVTWQVEFMADAAKVTFCVLGSTLPYRFLVQSDETSRRLQYVDTLGTITATGSGTNWITLDFGSRAHRKLVMEGEQAQGIAGIYVGASETVWPTEGADLLRGVWLTDSFGRIVVGGRANDSFANIMGAALGIRDRRIAAVGSRGWLSSASGTRFRVGEAIAVDAVPQTPDIGFICAGINDTGQSPAAVTAEVLGRVNEWRSALPAAPLFVFGVWPGQSGPSADILAIENAIAAGVAAAHDPRAIFIPVSTEPAGPWIGGTGKLGAADGTGNSDVYVSDDGTHPPPAGHLHLGLRGADAVMSKLHLIA